MSRRSFDLVRQQRNDLLEVYRKVCSSCHTQHEAWVKTIHHPAPRYYITPKQAHEMLSPLLRGDYSGVNRLRPHIRDMYLALFDELQRMSQKKDYIGRSLWHICKSLVLRPAPQFFITESHLRITFSECRKHGRDFHHLDIYPRRQK